MPRLQLNQSGQAAIFVALLFNVLFVFFAMAINVALVVHDKINLQNSADLAAYYAAMKQAEIMNVIAHENYMIRQSYKLLTWRYRALGTMGLDKGTSMHPVRTGEISETKFPHAGDAPSLCISYKPNWIEVPKGENLCNTVDLFIPALPQVQVIAGFLGINQSIARLSEALRMQFDRQCQKHGAYNWWFAMSILHAFRVDQRNRKQVIMGLARNLSEGQNGDFVDLDGNSVLRGARETFVKNLTFANRQAFESGSGEFQLFNSLQGVDSRLWLVEIKIMPTILYTDANNAGGNCAASKQPVWNLPQEPGARAVLNGELQAGPLIPWAQNSFLQDSDYQFSIGYERNPWYMPYMGVKVKTRPRQIFFPLGSGVEMSARSFAKPFGGRIGPWYQSRWDKGAPSSTGTKTDPFMAPRPAAGGLLNSPSDITRYPNYSRFPGDKLGLSSRLALNGIMGLAGLQASFNSYRNIKADMSEGSENDPLASDNGSAPEIRNLEIAALAPDLFDATYYSVEPNFSQNYFPRLVANKSALRIDSTTPIRADLGANGLSKREYSVQDQMSLARQRGLQRPEAFYFLREKAHLLTSWLPGPGAFNYTVEEAMEKFGKCGLPDDGLKFNNPGSCVGGGGRTGYSVKIISRDALLSDQHKIGGESGAPDSILNPPKAQDGW